MHIQDINGWHKCLDFLKQWGGALGDRAAMSLSSVTWSFIRAQKRDVIFFSKPNDLLAKIKEQLATKQKKTERIL